MCRVEQDRATEAFRQVSVHWAEWAPVLGYGFRAWVLADRRFQFGWPSSPEFVCLFSAALEYSHRHTLYDGAVVMEQGTAASMSRSTRREKAIFQPRSHLIVGSPANGGRKHSEFFVR